VNDTGHSVPPRHWEVLQSISKKGVRLTAALSVLAALSFAPKAAHKSPARVVSAPIHVMPPDDATQNDFMRKV